MAIRRENNQSFADSQADIRDEHVRYSELTGYVAEHFADARCDCHATTFKLGLDDDAGVAVRFCQSCGCEHGMADSEIFSKRPKCTSLNAIVALTSSRSRLGSRSIPIPMTFAGFTSAVAV
jgi:hypothetical protein